MSEKYIVGKPLRSIVPQKTLGEFFFDQAQLYGKRVCQVDTTTGKKELFQSVKQRSVRAALEMQKRGINPDDVILCCSTNTLDITIPFVATLFVGAKVATLDPTLPVRDVKHLISLVSPTVVFVEDTSSCLIERSLQELDGIKPDIVVLGKSDRYISFDEFQKQSPEETTFKPTKVDLHETAIMLFSSGSTGLPKAICLDHKGVLSNTTALTDVWCNFSAILHFTTFYWISAICSLFLNFMNGGYRLIMPKFEPKGCLEAIEKYKVSFIITAPILTYELTNYPNALCDTSSLHCLVLCGTPVSIPQLQRVKSLFKHTKVISGYGMTETGFVTKFDIKHEKLDVVGDKLTSCGKVMPNITVKIVDPASGDILGPNEQGEIRIKTPGIMNGYYNADYSEVLDKENFLKSGDTGYFDEDGFLYAVGRIKEMFKYKSWHIVPASVEAVLLQHPDVKEAAVFGMPHEEFGDVPCASVVLFPNSDVTAEEIKRFVADRVPDREQLRGGLAIVEKLERTRTGKLMRSQIRESFIRVCHV